VSRSKHIYELVMRLWPVGKVIYQVSHNRLFGAPFRMWFRSNSSEAYIIPVNEEIQRVENVILPYSLLTPLIEEAGTHFLMSECMCRRNEGCAAFPSQLGCLFLGEGAAQINPALGKQVTSSEALDHIQAALHLGLVPMVVHTTFDAYLLGIPYRRMLTVCFCCDCCCTVRHGLSMGSKAFWEIVNRLPGLSVEVSGACVGCLACLEVCPVRAIGIHNGAATIEGDCKGCGRCVEACPLGAIEVRIDNEKKAAAKLMERLRRRTDITGNGKIYG
jgi:ferredoxin